MPTTSRRSNKIAFYQFGMGILVISTDTGKIIRQFDRVGDSERGVSWSPDGQFFLYASTDHPVNPGASIGRAFTIPVEMQTHVYVGNVNTGQVTQITHDTKIHLGNIDPCWSPDGKKIAFLSFDSKAHTFDIYTTTFPGRKVERLTHDKVHKSRPAWSPSENLIAYVGRDKENNPLQLLDIDQMSLTTLCGNVNHKALPVWSPDGQQIAYSRPGDDESYVLQIFTINRDGTGEQQITTGLDDCTRPQWSLDGKRIAFKRHNDGGEYSDIYVVNSDGSHPKKVSKENGGGSSGYDWVRLEKMPARATPRVFQQLKCSPP